MKNTLFLCRRHYFLGMDGPSSAGNESILADSFLACACPLSMIEVMRPTPRRKPQFDPNSMLHKEVNGRILIELVGNGKIGYVYKAVSKDQPKDVLACKIIPRGNIKPGWNKEIEKVVSLRGIEQIVHYYGHGFGSDSAGLPYAWTFWEYIPGHNLRKFVDLHNDVLDASFVRAVAETLLKALYACQQTGVQHGDLHAGNILIRDPDSRVHGSKHRIYVTDFGYGGSHNNVVPKDDFRESAQILSWLLNLLNADTLNAIDKSYCFNLRMFLRKRLTEIDKTQGEFVRNIDLLLRELLEVSQKADMEAASGREGKPLEAFNDYLAAESIPLRAKEWKELFVPGYLAVANLLTANVTVLTGARGCGKTMVFRRLTAMMNKIVGEPSGVYGKEDPFVGFYLNCRDLVEAFPFFPIVLNRNFKERIIHYFHLRWLSEVCKTLILHSDENIGDCNWLEDLVVKYFGSTYPKLLKGQDAPHHVNTFVTRQMELCRSSKPVDESLGNAWPLSDTDFLDALHIGLRNHINLFGQKPIYLFLDDYTTPLVPGHVQETLNPVIFKRRAELFFKISTEAVNSFNRVTTGGKFLELEHDFELLDLATESLHLSDKQRVALLEEVFQPRIERNEYLKGRAVTLNGILGPTKFSGNEVAWLYRKGTTHELEGSEVQAPEIGSSTPKQVRTQILYQGLDVFVGMWSSDIRVMIEALTDILRSADSTLKIGKLPIDDRIQNERFRAKGGEFLNFAKGVAAPNDDTDVSESKSEDFGRNYGDHLFAIVEAFTNVSTYEMTRGKLISNDKYQNPRQAFRLEILDQFQPSPSAKKYLDGLTRWHIFFQDWRGKSVRGMLTPRLFLNRVLIPTCKLTFSGHDNIPLNNLEFNMLLTQPEKFYDTWKAKRLRAATKANSKTGQGDLFK